MSRLPFPGAYPTTRMRRLRTDGWIRELVAEHRLSASDLIWPIFVVEGDRRQPVESLPGVERHDLASAVEACRRARDLGIPVSEGRVRALRPHPHRLLRARRGRQGQDGEDRQSALGQNVTHRSLHDGRAFRCRS